MEYLFAGGIITAVAAFWNQAKSIVMQFYCRFVVTVDVCDLASASVLVFLRNECTVSRFGLRTYRGWLDFVRPAGRKQAVIAEDVGKGTRIYWLGRLPIWVRHGSSMADPARDETSMFYRPLSISFFRGTIDPDEFLIRSVESYNAVNCGYGDALKSKYCSDLTRRHKIHFITGTDGKPAQFGGNDGPSVAASRSDESPSNMLSCRLLQWEFADIGPHIYVGSSLKRMYLSSEAQAMVQEIRNWLDSREWHQERGLPWKRGFGLTGIPGTGKTTLVRGIAEDLDLPVFVFDLATLYNDELRREWQRVQASAPCIVLFDDIDAVFQDRVNEKSSLTFDCFLNCLDGVSRSDGILTFITTNRPELLSDALTRPGRIDRLIEMGKPDAAGREKMAARILADWPELAAKVAEEGCDDSGAEFERRCCDLAMELFWSEPKIAS